MSTAPAATAPAGATRLPRAATRRSGAVAGLAAVVAAVLAVVSALARQPGHPTDNIWAEDGTRFLTNAYQTPLPRALLLSYSGYLHLYPRLAGWLAAAVPPLDAARVLTLAGCLTTAAAAAAIVVSGRAVISWLPFRFVVAVAVPLLPNAASAVVGDVANAHVWLDLTALVMLFRPLHRDPAGAGGSGWPAGLETVACWLAVLLAAGSDPQALVLLPVAVARVLLVRRATWWAARGSAARRRRLAAEVVTAVLLAGCGAVQLVTVATNRVPTATVHPGLGKLAHLYLRDVAGSMLLGIRRGLDAGHPTLLAIALGLLAVPALTAAFPRTRERGALAGSLLVLSIALWVVPPWLKWTPQLAGHTGIRVEDSRYTVLSSAVLLLALAGCVDAWLARARRPLPARVVVLVVAVAVAGVAWAPALRIGPVREPSWEAGVRAGTVTCRSQPALSTVAVAGAPGSFHAVVPCSRLR